MPTGQQASCAILLLCGLPAAGKTFLSHMLLHQQRFLACRAVQVHHHCYDAELRVTLERSGGNFSPEAWQQARRSNMAKLELLLTSSQDQASSKNGNKQPGLKMEAEQILMPSSPGTSQAPCDYPVLVIVDDNMQYRSMRYRCLQLARKYSAAFLQIHISCPLQLSLQRNAEREGPNRVPAECIRRMAEVMEPPDPQLHPWESPSLVLQAEALNQWDGSELWQWISSSWGTGLTLHTSPTEDGGRADQDRAANAENAVHHVDICTRRMLSAFLSVAPQQQQAAWAKQLNASRRELLSKLRASWPRQQYEEEEQSEGRTLLLDHLIVEFDQIMSAMLPSQLEVSATPGSLDRT